MRRDPHTLGVARSRWTLATLREQLSWLGVRSDAGLSRLQQRLGIRRKRGRDWIHSPDADYLAKRAAIAAVLAAAADDPGLVVLDLDAVTIDRQPRVSRAYAAQGQAQAQVRRSTRAKTTTRARRAQPRHGRSALPAGDDDHDGDPGFLLSADSASLSTGHPHLRDPGYLASASSS